MIEHIFDVGENQSLVLNTITGDWPPIISPQVIKWMDDNINGAVFCGIVTIGDSSDYNEGLKFIFNNIEDIIAFKLAWS